MNLLEHYIIEVKKTTQLKNPNYLKVEVLCDCWGDERVVEHLTTKQDWQRDLERGYFMA